MKCPHCGEELIRSTKNPEYLLCYTCKKKYRVPGGAPVDNSAARRASRQHQQAQMRQRDTAYTQMLDIGMDEDEERGHGGLIFLIILLLIIAALVVGYFIFNIDYVEYVKQIIAHFKK
ncbi:MAG: hypothetical protein II787_04805 [Lachnospiraceae bacterium]|nr:hypothetical protein [Lachnospiraceae bacterium]